MFWVLIGLLLLNGLIACAPVSDSQEVTMVDTDESFSDSSMSQNQAPSSFAFKQFKSLELNLDLTELHQQLTGKYLHIKVTDDDANVYFVALVENATFLRTAISVPLTVTQISVEYYTEKTNESGLLMEMAL